jgi:aspartate/tyrosine/aromatic aminotransferase
MNERITQVPPTEGQEHLNKLTSSWEAERSQLRTKIVQLEHALVDAIERSNNPLRLTELSDANLRLLEEAKREWSAQWSAERDQLMSEIHRLRQLATSILNCEWSAKGI